MGKITGVVQRISERDVNTKFGASVNVGINIDGEWYSALTKHGKADLNVQEGKTVRFSFTENGKYKNIDSKTFQVSNKAAVAVEKPASSGGGSTGGNIAGVKVGHSLTNAVQLAIADKDPSIENIKKRAVAILNLSKLLEDNFDSLFVEPEKAVDDPQKEDDGFDEPQKTESNDDWDDDVPF